MDCTSFSQNWSIYTVLKLCYCKAILKISNSFLISLIFQRKIFGYILKVKQFTETFCSKICFSYFIERNFINNNDVFLTISDFFLYHIWFILFIYLNQKCKKAWNCFLSKPWNTQNYSMLCCFSKISYRDLR